MNSNIVCLFFCTHTLSLPSLSLSHVCTHTHPHTLSLSLLLTSIQVTISGPFISLSYESVSSNHKLANLRPNQGNAALVDEVLRITAEMRRREMFSVTRQPAHWQGALLAGRSPVPAPVVQNRYFTSFPKYYWSCKDITAEETRAYKKRHPKHVVAPCNSTTGLPWLEVDGRPNPDSKLHNSKWLTNSVTFLRYAALALSIKEDPALRAQMCSVLDEWTANETTAMLPDFTFSQVVPGDRRTGGGIIVIAHSWVTFRTLDAIWTVVSPNNQKKKDEKKEEGKEAGMEGGKKKEGMEEGMEGGREEGKEEERKEEEKLQEVGRLAPPAACSARIVNGFARWTAALSLWLNTTKWGVHNLRTNTNHATSYMVLQIHLYLFRGDIERATEMILYMRDVMLPVQIREDGYQHFEASRVNGITYTFYNLRFWMQTAMMARRIGIDLFDHVASNGAALRRAVDFAYPYVFDTPWPYSQKSKPTDWAADAISVFRWAALAYRNATYERAYAAVARHAPAVIRVAIEAEYPPMTS